MTKADAETICAFHEGWLVDMDEGRGDDDHYHDCYDDRDDCNGDDYDDHDDHDDYDDYNRDGRVKSVADFESAHITSWLHKIFSSKTSFLIWPILFLPH